MTDLDERARCSNFFRLPPLAAPTIDQTALGLIPKAVDTLLTTHDRLWQRRVTGEVTFQDFKWTVAR
jgi:hypothetical protein